MSLWIMCVSHTDWDVPCTDESCHIQTNHVTYKRVMSHSDIFTRLCIDFICDIHDKYHIINQSIDAVCVLVLQLWHTRWISWSVPCHSHVTVMSQSCHSHVTVMSQSCHSMTTASESVSMWHDFVRDMVRLYVTWFVSMWHDTSVHDYCEW